MRRSVAVCKLAVQIPVKTVQERANLFDVRPLHLASASVYLTLILRLACQAILSKAFVDFSTVSLQ